MLIFEDTDVGRFKRSGTGDVLGATKLWENVLKLPVFLGVWTSCPHSCGFMHE